MNKLEKFYMGISFLPWVFLIVLSRTESFLGENFERVMILSQILSGMGLALMGFALYRKRHEPIVPLVMGTLVASSYCIFFSYLFSI